jgi:hypothetical protein
MNGTGKSGIYPDPSGGFIAKAHTLVPLSVRSSSDAEVLQGVQYANQSIQFEKNGFTLLIQEGMQSLTIALQAVIKETVELLDADGHLLTYINSPTESFLIKGE